MLSEDPEEEKHDGEVKKSASLQRLQMLHGLETGGLISLSSDENSGVISRCRSSTSASTMNQDQAHGQSHDLQSSLQNLSTDENVCDHEECRKFVFVLSVPPSMTKSELRTFFSQFGNVQNVRIITNHRTKKSKGSGRVEFSSISEASSVLKLPKEKLRVGEKILHPVPNRCQKMWRHESTTKQQHQPSQNHGNKKRLPRAVKTALIKATSEKSETIISDAQDIEKPDPDCFINLLPSELLNYIFSFLDLKERIRIESVCKHWRRLNTTIPWVDMHELIFWKYFCNFRCARLNSRILYEILRRCGSTIRKLDFSRTSNKLSHNFPVVISNYCPNLEEVDFLEMPVTNKSLKILSDECKKLKIVNLERCDSVTEKGVGWLLKNCRLQQLSLSKNNRVTGSDFRFLSKEINMLNLNGCTKFTPAGLNFLCHCPNLVDLRLDHCRSVDSSSLVKVLECLGPKLIRLHGSGLETNVTTETFLKCLSYCKALQHLELENNCCIVDSVTEVISLNCLEIRTLNLNGTYFSDAGLLFLCNLPHLKKLHISYNCKITDLGMKELSQNGLLEHVELRGCAEIGDTACCPIVSNCGRLKLLDVSCCPRLSDVTVDAVLQMNRLEGQKVKVIAGGTRVKKFFENEHFEISELNLCPPSFHPWQFGMQDVDDVYVDGPLLDVQNLVEEQILFEEMMDEASMLVPDWYCDDDDDDDDYFSDGLDFYDEELDEFM